MACEEQHDGDGFPRSVGIKGRGNTYLGAAPAEAASLLWRVLGDNLKAGKIYVPLDRSLPVDRLKYILGNSSAGLILTNSQNVTSVGNLTKDKSQVINIDHLNPALLNEDPRSPISKVDPISWTVLEQC